MFELVVLLLAGHVVRDIDLNPARTILQRGKGYFAHGPLEHHAARYGRRRFFFFEILFALFPEAAKEVDGQIFSSKIIGESGPEARSAFSFSRRSSTSLLSSSMRGGSPYTPCL